MRERKRVQSWGSFSCQEKSKMTARNHWCSLSIVSCQLCLWFFFRDKLFFSDKSLDQNHDKWHAMVSFVLFLGDANGGMTTLMKRTRRSDKP